ncbi:hypothetical protein CF65_02835 [Aggregatibacter actinomycetemcomitans HK1651]|nr:hypothetical protein CF65_02835 [Aggregatibacter actinomycetemcomitans HK1651]
MVKTITINLPKILTALYAKSAVIILSVFRFQI